jgi:2'-5' RNA ligase
MHRLFIALRPPPAFRHRLAAVMAGLPGARWQDDDQLHLTLRFIGAVDRPVAEDAVAALAQIHGVAAEVTLAGVGAFDRKGRTDAIWAGVTPHDALAALHRKVDRALVRIGLEPERRAYLPHITLARFGRDSGGLDAFLERHAGLASAPFEVAHFALYESHLGQAGATYTIVERYDLMP